MAGSKNDYNTGGKRKLGGIKIGGGEKKKGEEGKGFQLLPHCAANQELHLAISNASKKNYKTGRHIRKEKKRGKRGGQPGKAETG